MAYSPVTGTAVQYSNEFNELASGYYLKFYVANDTTPVSMATDSTGNTLLVKCKLNPSGFPISNELDDESVFIPYVDQSYRLVIYKTEADADANDTANAFVNIAEVELLATVGIDWELAQLGTFMSYDGGSTANSIRLISVNTTPVTSLSDGQQISFRPTVTNTGVTTVKIDSNVTIAVKTGSGQDMPAGYILADEIMSGVIRNNQLWLSRRVESGSNVNGEYTRWEDGTATVTVTVDQNIDITGVTGAIFFAGSSAANPYPIAATSVEYADTSVVESSTNNCWVISTNSAWSELTAFPAYRIADTASTAGVDIKVKQTAKIKWY